MDEGERLVGRRSWEAVGDPWDPWVREWDEGEGQGEGVRGVEP